MFTSPVFKKLENAINEYLEESNKKQYNFTIEEQQALGKYINILDNQYKMLVDYELKKLEQEQKEKN